MVDTFLLVSYKKGDVGLTECFDCFWTLLCRNTASTSFWYMQHTHARAHAHTHTTVCTVWFFFFFLLWHLGQTSFRIMFYPKFVFIANSYAKEVPAMVLNKTDALWGEESNCEATWFACSPDPLLVTLSQLGVCLRRKKSGWKRSNSWGLCEIRGLGRNWILKSTQERKILIKNSS